MMALSILRDSLTSRVAADRRSVTEVPSAQGKEKKRNGGMVSRSERAGIGRLENS